MLAWGWSWSGHETRKCRTVAMVAQLGKFPKNHPVALLEPMKFVVCNFILISLFENYILVLIPKDGGINFGYREHNKYPELLAPQMSLTLAVIVGSCVCTDSRTTFDSSCANPSLLLINRTPGSPSSGPWCDCTFIAPQVS